MSQMSEGENISHSHSVQILPPADEDIQAEQGSKDVPLLPPPPESDQLDQEVSPVCILPEHNNQTYPLNELDATQAYVQPLHIAPTSSDDSESLPSLPSVTSNLSGQAGETTAHPLQTVPSATAAAPAESHFQPHSSSQTSPPHSPVALQPQTILVSSTLPPQNPSQNYGNTPLPPSASPIKPQPLPAVSISTPYTPSTAVYANAATTTSPAAAETEMIQITLTDPSPATLPPSGDPDQAPVVPNSASFSTVNSSDRLVNSDANFELNEIEPALGGVVHRPVQQTQPALIPVTPSMETLTNPEQFKYTNEGGVPMTIGTKGLSMPVNATKSTFTAVYNICNYIMGAGVLSMAALSDWNGVFVTPLMLILMGIFLLYTVFMLLDLCEATGCDDYDQLVEKCLGTTAKSVLNWSVALGTVGVLCSYMVLIGDFSETLANEAFNHSNRKLLTGVIGVCLVYPLCLLKNLSSLRFTSILSITFIFGTVVCIVVDCVLYMTSDGIPTEDITYAKTSSKIFRSIPIACFSYMCHLIVVPTRKDIPNKSLPQTKRVTTYSFLICGVVYVLSAIFGYLRFQSDLDGNVLNTYAEEDRDVDNRDIFTVCSSSFLFVIVFSYPMVSFGGRIGMHSLLFKGKPLTFYHNWIIVTTTFAISLIVALATSDVTLVFGLIGSITSPAVTMIFPALCSIAMSGQSAFSAKNLGPLLTLVFGFFVTITGVIYSVRDF